MAEPAEQTYGGLVSTAGDTCVLQFVNESNVPLRVFWLDFGGQKQQYARLVPPCDPFILNTFKSHPWVVEDDRGEVYAIYVGDSATVRIRGPNSFTVTPSNQPPQSSTQDSILSGISELLNQPNLHNVAAAAELDTPAVPAASSFDSGANADGSAPNNHSNGSGNRKSWFPRLRRSDSSSSDSSDEGDDGPGEHAQCSASGVRRCRSSKGLGGAYGCTICYEKLVRDVWTLKCGHMFHAGCLERACQRQLECPVCREGISGAAELRRVYPG